MKIPTRIGFYVACTLTAFATTVNLLTTPATAETFKIINPEITKIRQIPKNIKIIQDITPVKLFLINETEERQLGVLQIKNIGYLKIKKSHIAVEINGVTLSSADGSSKLTKMSELKPGEIKGMFFILPKGILKVGDSVKVRIDTTRTVGQSDLSEVWANDEKMLTVEGL